MKAKSPKRSLNNQNGGGAAKRRRILCSVCRQDKTDTVQIVCIVCKGFVQCLECFNAGKVVPPHEAEHGYRVRFAKKVTLFDDDWDVNDELMLLEALELYGLGNWRAISEHIGRPGKQCKRHYSEVYLNSPIFPLPQKPQQIQEISQTVVPTVIPTPTSGSRGGRRSAKPKTKHVEIAGYMPKRGDFDVEYDNDAELLLADLEFEDSDTTEDHELKLKMLEIYDRKLKVREKMKKIVFERGLLDFKKQQMIERRRPKAERQIYNSHRCFARFWSPEEHEEYMQGLAKELNLRQRIAKLQHYRLNGIRSLDEAEAYEQAKKQRELDLILTKRNSGGPTGAATPSAHTLVMNHTDATDKQSSSRTGQLAGISRDSPRASLLKPVVNTAGSDGYKLLPETEKRLCLALQLDPRQFQAVKAKIIGMLPGLDPMPTLATPAEASDVAPMDPALTAAVPPAPPAVRNATHCYQIDVHKVDRIFDFFATKVATKPSQETVTEGCNNTAAHPNHSSDHKALAQSSQPGPAQSLSNPSPVPSSVAAAVPAAPPAAIRTATTVPVAEAGAKAVPRMAVGVPGLRLEERIMPL